MTVCELKLKLLKFIAVCKDSYVIYVCGLDQMGKWSRFTESMRIMKILPNHHKLYIIGNSKS